MTTMARPVGDTGDLVYLAPHRWNSITQRSQQLTSALAMSRRVLYVEPVAPSLAGSIRRLARGEAAPEPVGLTQRGPSLWSYAPPPLLPLSLQFGSVNRLAHRLALPGLRRALSALAFAAPALVAAWPASVAWAGKLGESVVVYDCMDDFPAFRQSNRRREFAIARERELGALARLITVTSEKLADKWRPCHPRVEIVPNAVPDSFLRAAASASPAAEMTGFPSPRLLYIGAISDWLDDALLAQVAVVHPEWSLILVGPVENAPRALRQLPNVHFLGARPHDALPGYLVGADACLIPFKISPLTTAVNPVKLYEYLAAGKPVVSTALPEVARHASLCYLTAEGQSFVRTAEAAIAEAVDDPRRGARRQVAAENTWSRRAASYNQLLAGLPDSAVTRR